MGKLFDKVKKYTVDEDFDDGFFEDEEFEDDEEFASDKEVEEPEDRDETEDRDDTEDRDETEDLNWTEESDQFEELEEIDNSEEQELEEEIDDLEEPNAEEDVYFEEGIKEEPEEGIEEEPEEELEDEAEEEVEEELEDEAEDQPSRSRSSNSRISQGQTSNSQTSGKQTSGSQASQKKSDKPTPAELIAAYYREQDNNDKTVRKTAYQDEELDDATIRRRERRKRRIKNQILAYVITLAVLAGLITGGCFGGRAVWNRLKPETAEATEETTAAEEILDDLAESEEEIVIEAPEIMNEEPEPTEEDYLEEIVEACISAMPVEDKVAQLFMVTPESLTGASKVTQAGEKTQEVLNQYRVGGFVYFGDNLVDKEQVTNMISATAGYNLYDMFFAIDEEGGKVSRVQKSKIEVPEVGNMSEIGATGDANKAYEAGKTIGQYLRELGFNVDFAPVADVVTATDKATIGDRSFGSDPAVVGQMVQKCAEGIQENGVSACLKHFPGLGDTTTDTHEERVVIEKSLEELQATDFVAFKDAIDAGVDFVMVSHATATGIDEVYPSSLSKKVITEQLRDYLGYDGIVITDAFNMKAITEYYTTEEACVKAIKAGADMILMPENFEAGYNAVLEAVKDGSISEERIDESLKRIFRVKKRDEIVK